MYKLLNKQQQDTPHFFTGDNSLKSDEHLYIDSWNNVFSIYTYETYIIEYGNYFGEILRSGASVNMYMFHGGTNFGFLNGANQDNDRSQLKPDVTNYGESVIMSPFSHPNPFLYFIFYRLRGSFKRGFKSRGFV